MEKETKIYTSGKRKTAVARAVLGKGEGKILFNGKNYENLPFFDKLKIIEPIKIAEKVLGKIDFDVSVKVHGGGDKGQIDAARLAIAKAIIKFTNSDELKQVYLDYDRNLLVADIRRKETCKPGDSKARAKRQSSKR